MCTNRSKKNAEIVVKNEKLTAPSSRKIGKFKVLYSQDTFLFFLIRKKECRVQI